MIKCTLDDDECIDLLTALRVINQITQEQAWAIGYQLASLMQRLAPASCAPIDSLASIYIHKDGMLHDKTCLVSQHHQTPEPNTSISKQDSPQQPPTPPITPELNEELTRRPFSNETELVASLGIALFWALDYGIPDDEERKLSITMEYLILQSQSKMSLKEVSEICINRLPLATKANADLHYKEICKSLVGDTIELSIFLEKIYTASMVLGDIGLNDCLEANHKCDINDHDLREFREPLASLRALRINEWARLWMQVIRELRQRGKFKQAALLVN